MERFVVMNSPFVHSGNDVNKMFIYMAVALTIPAVYGIIFFGIQAAFVILLSLATCLLSEMLFNLVTKKKFKVDNFSFFVTGMILALTLPVEVPFYVVIGSGFFSIFVVKQVFGGLGFNKFNPALCGRCLAGVIVPALASELYEFTLNEETYTSLACGGENSITNLLSGQAVGGIGTTCIVLIFVCAFILAYTKVIDVKIPIIAVLSYFVVGTISVGYENAIMNMFSGSFVFICVFMLTDPNTSPDTFLGKILYAILFGVLSALVWNNGSLGENSLFAVALAVNIVAPIFDKYLEIKPVARGGYRNAYKK
ncbi:MAG: RnfABCDGE type electron transport complex subunit D [Clostridia bacterium]|nr:RnfABCDGE type electron transport complex subunit D [Clostridia bacterium]